MNARPIASSSTLRTTLLALLAVTVGLSGCSAGDDIVELDPGAGGNQCFAAFDFNTDVTESVVFDGQSCPNVNAACGGGDTDWPVATDISDTDYTDFMNQRTRIAHYRTSPPADPAEYDLYVVFEVDAAEVNDIAAVSIALSPTSNATDGKALLIEPFNSTPSPGQDDNLSPASTSTREWNGSSWVNWAAPGGAFEAEAAYNTMTGYWGVEVRLDLDKFGIALDEFYMALHWRSDDDAGVVTADDWHPWEALPGDGSHFPDEDPTEWVRYSFAEDCHPDVWIDSEYNTCNDIYINEQDENARLIAINNVNEFHAVVHGDDDPGEPDLGGVTAEDVRVYMDISHLGNGHLPYAMNYPHTNANINWEGAAHSLDTATPEPPTPFDVAAGATNDDVRVEWKPADESPNPFEDGEHVCVNAYVYFKDDPNLDNNFGQCNMDFVEGVEGRMFAMSFGFGMGFRLPGGRDATQLIFIPLVVNSGLQLTEKNEIRFQLEGEGIEQIGPMQYMARVSPRQEGMKAELQFFGVPELFTAPRAEVMTPFHERTRKFYGERPLVILKSFVPTRTRTRNRELTLMHPGSYIGFALEP